MKKLVSNSGTKSVVTPEMEYRYSTKIVFQLYLKNLVTEAELKEISAKLKMIYGIVDPPHESNEDVRN